MFGLFSLQRDNAKRHSKLNKIYFLPISRVIIVYGGKMLSVQRLYLRESRFKCGKLLAKFPLKFFICLFTIHWSFVPRSNIQINSKKKFGGPFHALSQSAINTCALVADVHPRLLRIAHVNGLCKSKERTLILFLKTGAEAEKINTKDYCDDHRHLNIS